MWVSIVIVVQRGYFLSVQARREPMGKMSALQTCLKRLRCSFKGADA